MKGGRCKNVVNVTNEPVPLLQLGMETPDDHQTNNNDKSGDEASPGDVGVPVVVAAEITFPHTKVFPINVTILFQLAVTIPACRKLEPRKKGYLKIVQQ